MTENSPPPPSETKAKKRTKGKLPPRGAPEEEERFSSATWNESFPDGDPLAFLADGIEGGFSMLEEIDESECEFFGKISEPEGGGEKLSFPAKSMKRNRKGGDGSDAGEDDSSFVEEGSKQKVRKKKKPKKKKKKVAEEEGKKQHEEGESANANAEETGQMYPAPIPIAGRDRTSYLDGDNEDDEYSAWLDMRLHPLLMESIRRLGFQQPTPIQKACIPAVAHKGKDVIGAAETGSGKTIAFGLPILDRLLKECEKEGTIVSAGIQRSPLRALIVTPTRELALQVTDHIKEVAKLTNIRVVPIVGGMSTEKQERLLKRRPEIVVGTPGRLWELMSGAEEHLVELHSLSFFVLDEADRMIEHGHFNELQSIIDMLPSSSSIVAPCSEDNCNTVPKAMRKKRQTCVFSATLALSDGFRKKLKGGFFKTKSATTDGLNSIERLSQRAGIRADVAIVDLTSASIVADKLEESFIECSEENKEAYLYYILTVHGHGRTIVFCTSIAALRRISSLLHILHINVWTLHAQMQQRARLKALDRFRESENGILAATDVAARGLDIPGIRTVIHYQLPHSAEVYIHRSGRTARASADGCCISLISPSDRAKFSSLCKSLSRENLRQFPLVDAYMPEVMKRVSLACQIDKILRKNSQENVNKSWLERNAESLELMVEDSDSEEEKVQSHKQKKGISFNLKKLQQELNSHLARPLQPRTFSRRFLAGAGLSPLIQRQLEELSKQKQTKDMQPRENRRTKLVVIGQDCIEPLQALRSAGHEICVDSGKKKEARRLAEHRKRKRKVDKKLEREQRKKQRKAKEQVN